MLNLNGKTGLATKAARWRNGRRVREASLNRTISVWCDGSEEQKPRSLTRPSRKEGVLIRSPSTNGQLLSHRPIPMSRAHRTADLHLHSD